MDRFTLRVLLVGRIVPDGVDLLGTAFTVGVNGLLVTSRHVIGNDPRGLVVMKPHTENFNDYQDVSDTKAFPTEASVVDVDPIADLATLKINVKFSDVLELGSLDDIKIGEPVGIFGFPHCIDGRRVLTFQPSTIGAKVFLDSSSIKIKHAVVNFQTRPGQSGSMVYSPRLGKVVGILSGTYAPTGMMMLMGGINPAELNQTSHIVSAEYALGML